MASLDDIQVKSIVESTHVFFFKDPNIPIYVQIPQMLLPLLETDYANYLLQHRLQRLSSCIDSALNDSLVVLWEHFVLFKNHGARPWRVVDGKV